LLHLYRTPRLLRLLSSNLIWNVNTSEKEIYLTFDDGPIPDLTDYVLDLLKQYEAEATFFCVGDNIRKHPDIFDKILRHGHAVGNHTFNHMKAWSNNITDYLENIEKCQQILESKLGKKGKALFRPPHGQIDFTLIKALKQQYLLIMWDILSYDFDHAHSAKDSLKRVTKKTKPGSIIVFHDSYKAEAKLKYMLPKFLSHFTNLGYTFKKLMVN